MVTITKAKRRSAVLTPSGLACLSVMRGAEYPIQNLSAERRDGIFARLQTAAEAHGIQLDICACKNSEIASGSCNIASTWPARTLRTAQLQLLRLV
jgi:hypothetical protein